MIQKFQKEISWDKLSDYIVEEVVATFANEGREVLPLK